MSPGLGLGAQAPKHNLSSPKWMSAHLVLRATQLMLMNNIRCSIQLDNEQRLAYPNIGASYGRTAKRVSV